MSSDLTAFIRARLDEDERIASAAPKGPWTAFTQDDIAGASVYDSQWLVLTGKVYKHNEPLSDGPRATGPGYINPDAVVAHAARQDPTRVLAEVRAKRQMVRLHSVSEGHECSTLDHNGEVDQCTWVMESEACTTLRLLALPYAGHPDYREAWKP